MECPFCGYALPSFTIALAATDKGTQCPKCWSRLRRLTRSPLPFRKKTAKRQPRPVRRAA